MFFLTKNITYYSYNISMKKILLLLIILIFIPFIIIYLADSYSLKEINLKYINNITVRVKRLKTDTIEIIPLEEYVVGVLAGEMPIYFELNALKAQAVAARSYVLKRLEYNKDSEYDVVDSITNQVYLDNDYLKTAWKNNYVSNINKLRTAVNETYFEYLEYDGKVIDALFFSTSNGYTENAELVFNFSVPYLKSVESKWDSETSSAFNASTTISLLNFYEKLSLTYNENINIEIVEKSSTNRILSLKINNVLFKGTDIYNKLGLKSTDFSISKVGSNIVINTSGYGHGVGMSQYGAQGMALNGHSYKEILFHYYTGTTIKKINN